VYSGDVSTKTKRTYNISTEAVATVKRLVEERHIAPSQDALVEQAIAELARRVRDADDARLWEQAATDLEYQAETGRLDAEFGVDDRHAWNP
jgi:hypothetical protein